MSDARSRWSWTRSRRSSTIAEDRIETRQTELSAEHGEELLRRISLGTTTQVAKILDIKTLLEAAFAQQARARRQSRGSKSGAADDAAIRRRAATPPRRCW